MTKKQKILTGAIVLIVALIIGAATFYFRRVNVPVLNPQGAVGMEERSLFIFTIILSLFVVIPVFALLIVISLKYREKNAHKAKYAPDWDGNRKLELTWWAIPCVIILILSVITWITSHQLDPMKPLSSNTPTLNVQVVALQWKWLFIYPDQHVASVNHLEIPEKTPISFNITSDAPMNAFWIPSLGTQVYAMSGMSAQLHLIADSTGQYEGRSSNISGTHFADMHFSVNSVNNAEFSQWVSTARHSSGLTMDSYNQLAQPSVAQPSTFMLQDQSLYSEVIAKYQEPASSKTNTGGMQ